MGDSAATSCPVSAQGGAKGAHLSPVHTINRPGAQTRAFRTRCRHSLAGQAGPRGCGGLIPELCGDTEPSREAWSASTVSSLHSPVSGAGHSGDSPYVA